MQFNENKYSALLEEIFSLTPSVQNVGFTGEAYKPGLEAMRKFDAHLGHPWKQYPCIHIAGTNGKGSVASMLASAFATRLKAGLYTSPHLTDFRERMKVISNDGFYMPSKEEVWEFFQEHDVSGLSFFEITTGLAFWWFAKQKIDIAIIEAGLGGRLDSTNIITPELTIITSIGLDHCALLGDTRAAIAREKAGIFKRGVTAIVASTDNETSNVFREASGAAGCPLIFADTVSSGFDEEALLSKMDLQGPCQSTNLHTALIAFTSGIKSGTDSLRPTPPLEGNASCNHLKIAQALKDIPVSEIEKAIEKTAERTGLRGRWERLSKEPEIICDIGHNPPALEINFARLQNQGKPLTIICGFMADKDLDGIARLLPSKAKYILSAPDIPRALPADKLLQKLSSLRPDLSLTTAPTIAEGISQAIAESPENGLIYIGGSSFVVTEALEYFKARPK